MKLFGMVCQKGLVSVIAGLYTLIGCISSEIIVAPLSPGYTSMYTMVDINRRGIRQIVINLLRNNNLRRSTTEVKLFRPENGLPSPRCPTCRGHS